MEHTQIVSLSALQQLDVIRDKSSKISSEETPKKYIKNRTAKGGGTWKYAKADYFEDMLTKYYPGWSMEISEPKIVGREGSGFVHISVNLTIIDEGIVRKIQDVGGAEIKYYGQEHARAGDYLDLPNDIKAAITDGLKRCCYRLGFARDLKYEPADLDMSEKQFQFLMASIDNMTNEGKEKIKKFAYQMVTRANFDAFMKETVLKLLLRDEETNKEQINSLKKFYNI